MGPGKCGKLMAEKRRWCLGLGEGQREERWVRPSGCSGFLGLKQEGRKEEGTCVCVWGGKSLSLGG